MATNFIFEDVGEGLTEGTIVKWLVKVGDTVKADQNIVQVETDKAVVDLPSPASGTILSLNVAQGDVAKVGSVLCVIGTKGETISTPKSEVMAKKSATVSAPHVSAMHSAQTTEPKPKMTQTNGEIRALPAARKLAQEKGIDLSMIRGTGPDGAIMTVDVVKAMEQQTTKTKPSAGPIKSEPLDLPTPPVDSSLPVRTDAKGYEQYGPVRIVAASGIRKAIAQNMMKSQNVTAPVTATEDIDVSAVHTIREREKGHFELEGIKLTYLPFVVRAVTQALTEFSDLNGVLEGDSIIYKEYVHIGIAVQSDVGLVVPVIRDAAGKSIAQIAKEIRALAAKAKARALSPNDMRGGSFTITNYGSVGGIYGTPIINLGESAILGVGRIFDRVVLDEKTGKLRNAKILPVSLTFDHRLIDGAIASAFLMRIKESLEHPESIFLEKRDSKVKR
jgi:pyruvate dehydrogenase E2 component (dihydrolipoamide acetyltransferase)